MPANLLNYAQYDFDLLVLQLQDRLKNTDAWKDIYRSGTGEMLIEFLAYVLNLCMYYVERRAEESYLPTAQNRSSVVNLVALLNYNPKRQTSAVGNLEFSIDSPMATIVYIPKYTECQTADGVKYLTNEGGAIQKGQTSVTLKGIQGELVQTEISSNGISNQEYLISDTSVENSSDTENPTLRVIVDGTEWTMVSSFLNSNSTSQHYKIINEMDGNVSVLFGDNVNGKTPVVGSTIVIQYIRSSGADGNVTYTGRITTLNSTIYDEDSSVVTVLVTNVCSFLGGDAEESIEEIRTEAPQVFRTGDRAVTRGDFIAILENYSGVAAANVWGENEEAEVAGVAADYQMLNRVRMSMILQEWELPDVTFKATVAASIYAKSMLTVKYEWIDPVILTVIPILTVKVTKGSSLSGTQADIETALAAQFSLGDTTKIGTLIKYSHVLAAVDNITSVAYANMTLEIKKALSNTYSSTWDWGATIDATPVKPGTVRLFIGSTYQITDVDNGDGTGSFSGTPFSYTISGTINYTTGVLTLNVSPAASSVYVRYQQDESGNIRPTFRQICKLDSVDITSITMES